MIEQDLISDLNYTRYDLNDLPSYAKFYGDSNDLIVDVAGLLEQDERKWWRLRKPVESGGFG